MPKQKHPKQRGRRKLSLYNRTARYYWKVVKDNRSKGNQISYQDARVKLKKVYEQVKSIKEETGKSPFIGSKKRDYNLIKRLYRVTKLTPIDYPKEEELLPLPSADDSCEWYMFNRTMQLLDEASNGIYDNLQFEFELDDSGSVDGQSFILIEIEGRKIRINDITPLLYHTAIWWYLREHNNGEYNVSPVPKYYIKERRGNEYVKYGLTGFTAGDGTTKPTPIKPTEEKPPVVEDKQSSESDAVRIQELKTKEAESLKEIESEKTKQLEIKRKTEEKYFDLLSENKIDAAMFERLVNQLYK